MVGLLPRSGRKEYILVLVDAYSNYMVACAMSSKKAKEIGDHIFADLITWAGCPKIIRSDKAAEFMSNNRTYNESV